MRPPDLPFVGLANALTFTALVAVFYLAIGAVQDARRRHHVRVRDRMQGLLATVLFGGEDQAAEAAEQLGRTPRTLLFDMVQRLAADFVGDVDARLRNLVASAALTRPIRARLTSRSWRRRAQGAALASLLPQGDPHRVRLLTDPHPVVRARAAESLDRSDIADHAAALTGLLDDPSKAVRFAAQQALLRGDTNVVAPLLEYLDSDERPGMVWALEVAANLPDPRVVPAIERHTRSQEPLHRATATRALGPWVVDVDVLVERLNDEAPEVRAMAAEAAATAGAETLAAHIGRLLRDEHWQVRRAAGVALSNLGSAGSMTLRIHLEDEDPYARDMARQKLATIAARYNSLRPASTASSSKPERAA